MQKQLIVVVAAAAAVPTGGTTAVLQLLSSPPPTPFGCAAGSSLAGANISTAVCCWLLASFCLRFISISCFRWASRLAAASAADAFFASTPLLPSVTVVPFAVPPVLYGRFTSLVRVAPAVPLRAGGGGLFGAGTTLSSPLVMVSLHCRTPFCTPFSITLAATTVVGFGSSGTTVAAAVAMALPPSAVDIRPTPLSAAVADDGDTTTSERIFSSTITVVDDVTAAIDVLVVVVVVDMSVELERLCDAVS
uniref:Uncharacterized protein n=1 Tax=Anopheles coluzzii TaxID=1518534 RepID=A0A8W7Q1D8_ANOCL